MLNDNSSIIDKDTKFTRVPSGKAKDVIVTVDPDGKTVLLFIKYKKIVGNHVDEIGVISKLSFNNFRSLKSFQKTIQEAIEKHENTEI